MSWQDLAYKLDDVETLISFFLLSISFYFYRITSNNIALAVWVCSNYLMERWAQIMLEMAKTDAVLVRQLWYSSFITVDVIAIAAIYMIHIKMKIEFTRFSEMVCASFFFMACLQLMRYVDRMVLDADITTNIYKYGILTFSMTPMFLMVLILSAAAIEYLRKRISV